MIRLVSEMLSVVPIDGKHVLVLLSELKNRLSTTFSELDWVATAITIIAVVISAVTLFLRMLRSKRRPFNRLASWVDPKLRYLIDQRLIARDNAQEAVAIATIAIVDDQPNDFPVKELRAANVDVKVYRQISLEDTTTLAEYDIVFLDMKGIIRDNREEGGLKLIEGLRKVSPMQKICAVSAHTFDPTATRFFRLANDLRKKPLRAQHCMDVIGQFVADLFSPRKNLISSED